MKSQPGKQTIAIDLLSNISRSKGNQAIKFGQSIKYTTCKITQIVMEKVFPNPFVKNQN